MTRCIAYLLCVGLFAAGLAGCSEDSAPTPAAPPKVVTSAPVKEAPAADVQQAEEQTEPEYVYETEGRRDPFLPLTAIRKPVGGEVTEPLTPLQQYELGQYRLIGVIVGLDQPRAMVVAPDGKSYILKKGIKIGKNNGVVLDISGESVQVEEKYYDFSGNVRTNIQDIVVPKREGV